MRNIKSYKLFEYYSEPGFDRIFFQSQSDIELKAWIKELNNHNRNFDPYIIKDLFIDFIDNGLITDIEISKLYKKEKSTKTIKGVSKPVVYINYIINVSFKLNNHYSDEFYELRKEYLKERDGIRDILYYHYGHKSLNCELSKWNLFDIERVNGDRSFKKNKDDFDLWSKALCLD